MTGGPTAEEAGPPVLRPGGCARARRQLLAIGFYAPGTGFTRVLSELLSAVGTDYAVDWVGAGYDGPETTCAGARVYPVQTGGRDVLGAYRAAELARAGSPAVVFVLHDLWHLGRYARILRPALEPSARLVAYLPLDGAIADPELVRELAAYDLVLVYTPAARRDLEGALAALVNGQADFRVPPVEVLPHGVDLARFTPEPSLVASGFAASGRREARQRVFPELPDDAFVVLNPSRPARRKRLDLTLAGFARFAGNKPASVRLCLHQAISTPELRAAILAQAAALGIGERLLLDPLGSRRLDDDELALLYGACDVGLNTSMGEGWGLVAFEHGACGGAQVLPDFGACGELWAGAAELVPIARRYVPDFSRLEMAEVEAADVAAALERLHAHPEELARRSRQAVARAGDAELSWTRVGQRLRSLLASCTARS